jgi:O-antigen/teichoic acid export membrane protein
VLAAVLVLNLVLNLILIPPFGINGAAFATLASECASLAGMAYAYSRIGPVPRLHAPVGALLAGAVMVALVLGTRTVLGHVSSSPFPTLAVGGSISVLVYAFAVSRLGGLPPAASEAITGILRRRIRHA